MEGILTILIIIVAAVMSNKKKKMRQAAVRPERPDLNELQTKRALENSMEQTMLPLDLINQEDEEEAAQKVHKPERRIPGKMMMEHVEIESMEGVSHAEGRKLANKVTVSEKPGKDENAAEALRDEDDLEFVSKLNQQEMVRAVILSEILNRRPQSRNRRYS